MNLLFDFLKHLSEKEKQKLASLPLKGRSKEVWILLNQQATKQDFDREKIEKTLGISSAHFDKITSQVLSRCYEHLYGDDGLALLGFLSERVTFVKHYYQEMKRQMSFAEKNFPRKQLTEFYKANVNFIHFNMPIIHKDEGVLKQLAEKYLAIEKDRKAQMLIECKLIFVQIDKLFAAAQIQNKEASIQRQLDKLGPLPTDASEELAFAYYWLRIYFPAALERFEQAYSMTQEALTVLGRYSGKEKETHVLRIKLKEAEQLYYLSRFEQSFEKFTALMASSDAQALPDYSYYSTKYAQICFITGHLQEAEISLQNRQVIPLESVKSIILPRDIISAAKYYIFSGKYEDAFDAIQLGFEKNPKGKYFQYEVELRNLQTAYFYLTNQRKLAVQVCNKHIKYLRSHGYGIRESDFPFFFVLTKSMHDKKERNKKLSAKEVAMLQRYQLGSYAVYGKLLLKMLEA
jgi:hypothetical protein